MENGHMVESDFPMVNWQKATSCVSLKSPGINITTGAPVAIKLESVKAQHPLSLDIAGTWVFFLQENDALDIEVNKDFPAPGGFYMILPYFKHLC